MTDLLGQTIGNCRIEALLGSGGMGQVFRAQHIHLGRLQAIKVLHSQLAQEPSFRARFLREARTLASLDHAHIVTIYECGDDHGRLFLSMELLRDGSVRGLLERRAKDRQQWPRAFGLSLVRQAADALAFAHEKGIVHRDIKPDNLLVIRERHPGGTSTFQVKVSDFGLAQIADGGVLTATGLTVGTPAYMSPEQCRGLDLDGRSDIYSLGVVLYELMTGYLPFAAKTTSEVVRKHVQEPPRSPREVDPNLPQPIEALIMRCLAKDPEQRFGSARELAEALGELIAAERSPVQATPTPPSAPPPPAGFIVKVIDASGRLVRSLALPEAGLSVGRLPGNDLALDHPEVSRSHLRISRGRTRARVTDLGSTGGTLLAGKPLVPLVEQPWAIGETLRVGPFTLSIEAMAAARLGIALPDNGKQLTLTPGKPAVVSAVITNNGTLADRIVLAVEGFPAAWVQLPTLPPTLAPGAPLTVALVVEVPPGSASRAGDYTVALRGHPAADPSATAEALTRWRIAPAPAATLTVTPLEITAPQEGVFTIQISNDGNLPARYRLSAQDPSGDLRFTLANEPGELEPGATAAATLTVQSPRRILGRRRSYPFVVRAETSDLACEATATFFQDGPLLF